MNGSVIREPSRSLKEQFSKGSDAWKEQSDPIFRFWTEGDWWGFPFFSLSASRYFGDNETSVFIGRLRPSSLQVRKWSILRWVLRPLGNVSQGRWKRHQSPGI
jgi:hypothetical protein